LTEGEKNDPFGQIPAHLIMEPREQMNLLVHALALFASRAMANPFLAKVEPDSGK
jgi:hypothetical protein